MPSSINSNGILQKSQKGLSFGDMGCRVSKEGIQKEIITVAAHLRAAIGLRAAFGKGVFSKPSGKCIVVPNFCFLS